MELFKTPKHGIMEIKANGFTLEVFSKFLEFCYCDRVVSPITGLEAQNLALTCQ